MWLQTVTWGCSKRFILGGVFDAAYWLAAAVVPVIFATTTALIALLGVRLVAWGQAGHPGLASLLGLFGLSLVCGVLLGVGAGGIGWICLTRMLG